MTGAALQRPHVWRPGATGAPLLLLHGTGGDEHNLLPLAERLAPAAPVLSVRGSVLENGMPRFSRRLAEGVFDEDDLRERVDELAAFLIAAEKEYGVEAGSWTAVGFSNGANIASALLMLRPQALTAAVLLAAMVPFAHPPDVDLTGKRVLVANGRRDPWPPQRTLRPSSPSSTGVERRSPSSRTTAGTPSMPDSCRVSPSSCGRCAPSAGDVVLVLARPMPPAAPSSTHTRSVHARPWSWLPTQSTCPRTRASSPAPSVKPPPTARVAIAPAAPRPMAGKSAARLRNCCTR
jgi:phospholipase/carboxylesterase